MAEPSSRLRAPSVDLPMLTCAASHSSEIEKNRLREGLIELKTTEFEREDTIRKTEESIAQIKAKSEEEQTKKTEQEEKKEKFGLCAPFSLTYTQA